MTHLSLSVRIAEGFLSKEEATMDLASVASLAKEAGYQSVCMRASQIGIQTSPQEIAAAAATLKSHGLGVTMISGDFDIVHNNEHGPNCLRNIEPYLDLAESLGARMIRVALKTEDDIPHARRAADAAAERDIHLLHQCHIQSLFETVEGCVETLEAVNRPNFGLIYEAANLDECGQPYGGDSIRRLAPWIRNVYLQNLRLGPEGAVTLETWCRGPVSFDLIPIAEPGGVDFSSVFQGLQEIGYTGPISIHQCAPEDGSSALESAKETAQFCRKLLGEAI